MPYDRLTTRCYDMLRASHSKFHKKKYSVILWYLWERMLRVGLFPS